MKILFTFLLLVSISSFHARGSCLIKNSKSTHLITDSLKLDSFIKKNVFKFTDGKYQGGGWDFLLKEIHQTQFVLIGEQHGEAEIPVFTAKIAQEFRPKALVVEIDPYTAAQLKKVSINPAGYSEYFKHNPYAFAFYSWQTEMELARQMQLSHIDIWGLNEINFLSLGRFFYMLSDCAKLPQNKKIALAIGHQYQSHDQPLFGDINGYSNFIAYKIKPATVDSLMYQFRNESAQCKKMLSDLKTSLPVFANTSYSGRVNLMKKNLLNYLAPYISSDSIKMPRLLFKFGANHVTRTDDLKGYFEVGSLADNLAGAAGKETLHILIFGKKGTNNQMAPVNNSQAIVPYDITEDKELAMFKPFSDPVKEDEWAVYDLRPIRDKILDGKLPHIDAELKAYIMGYDLLVIFGKVTGNRFID